MPGLVTVTPSVPVVKAGPSKYDEGKLAEIKARLKKTNDYLRKHANHRKVKVTTRRETRHSHADIRRHDDMTCVQCGACYIWIGNLGFVCKQCGLPRDLPLERPLRKSRSRVTLIAVNPRFAVTMEDFVPAQQATTPPAQEAPQRKKAK